MAKSKVFAIILAAGSSKRFRKGNKLLHKLADGRTVIQHVIDTVSASVSGTIIVTKDTNALPTNLGMAEVVTNPEGEMTSSFKNGVTRAQELSADAVLLVLGDQPYITLETINAVIRAFRSERNGHSARIVHPHFLGKRVHPVLFSKELFNQILTLPPEKTMKDFVRAHENEVLPVCLDTVSSSKEFKDIDTVEDVSEDY